MDARESITVHSDVDIALGPLRLQGILGGMGGDHGIVVFAHGSGATAVGPGGGAGARGGVGGGNTASWCSRMARGAGDAVHATSSLPRC